VGAHLVGLGALALDLRLGVLRFGMPRVRLGLGSGLRLRLCDSRVLVFARPLGLRRSFVRRRRVDLVGSAGLGRDPVVDDLESGAVGIGRQS
jgi:hypothetical protein